MSDSFLTIAVAVFATASTIELVLVIVLLRRVGTLQRAVVRRLSQLLATSKNEQRLVGAEEERAANIALDAVKTLEGQDKRESGQNDREAEQNDREEELYRRSVGEESS